MKDFNWFSNYIKKEIHFLRLLKKYIYRHVCIFNQIFSDYDCSNCYFHIQLSQNFNSQYLPIFYNIILKHYSYWTYNQDYTHSYQKTVNLEYLTTLYFTNNGPEKIQITIGSNVENVFEIIIENIYILFYVFFLIAYYDN